MAIDTSMYSNFQLPDFVGSYMRGAEFKEKRDAAKAQQQIEQAKKNVYTLAPDGKMSLSKEGLQRFAQVAPEQAYQIQRQFSQDSQADQKSNYEGQLRQYDLVSRGLSGATPENWGQVRESLIKQGVGENEIPEMYDKKSIDYINGKTMSYMDRLNQEAKDRGFKLQADQFDYTKKKDAQGFGLDKEKFEYGKTKDQKDFELRLAEIAAKKEAGAEIPIDSKKMIEGLSTKNANKLSIKNQLDAFSKSWDKMDETQKIVQGRQLLKTLNSPEGADAIGAEEAKRLGGLLEYKLFNFTDPGSFVGRDIDEFKKQVDLTARNIGVGINSNQAQIDKLMGRAQSAEQYAQTPVNQNSNQGAGMFGVESANAAPVGVGTVLSGSQIDWAD